MVQLAVWLALSIALQAVPVTVAAAQLAPPSKLNCNVVPVGNELDMVPDTVRPASPLLVMKSPATPLSPVMVAMLAVSVGGIWSST
jgi:hypothetical protein